MDQLKGLTSWLIAAADTDGDGKITIKDAKKGVFDFFDKDGDGKITFDEMEGGVASAMDNLERGVTIVRRTLQPFKSILLFSFGWFACYYGKNFNYTILFVQAFRVTGWPVVKRAFDELKASYLQSRSTLRKEFPVIADANARAQLQQQLKTAQKQLEEATKQQKVNTDSTSNSDLIRLRAEVEVLSERVSVVSNAQTTVGTLSQCVDPVKLTDIVKGLYTGMVACFATALSSGAAKIGVGMNVGTVISTTVNNTLRPILRQLISRAVNSSTISAPKNPTIARWTDTAVGAVCNSVGVACAYYFERTMFTVSNALTGAELMTQQIIRAVSAANGVMMENSPLATIMLYGLCASGVYSQIVLGRGELPLIARFVLFVPLAFERYLGLMVAAARASIGV